MGIQEKIANAKPSTWLTDGLTDKEVKQAIEDGKKQIRHCRECKHSILHGARDMWGAVGYTYRCKLQECKFEPKEG